jgi:hypothetical protein
VEHTVLSCITGPAIELTDLAAFLVVTYAALFALALTLAAVVTHGTSTAITPENRAAFPVVRLAYVLTVLAFVFDARFALTAPAILWTCAAVFGCLACPVSTQSGVFAFTQCVADLSVITGPAVAPVFIGPAFLSRLFAVILAVYALTALLETDFPGLTTTVLWAGPAVFPLFAFAVRAFGQLLAFTVPHACKSFGASTILRTAQAGLVTRAFVVTAHHVFTNAVSFPVAGVVCCFGVVVVAFRAFFAGHDLARAVAYRHHAFASLTLTFLIGTTGAGIPCRDVPGCLLLSFVGRTTYTRNRQYKENCNIFFHSKPHHRKG